MFSFPHRLRRLGGLRKMHLPRLRRGEHFSPFFVRVFFPLPPAADSGLCSKRCFPLRGRYRFFAVFLCVFSCPYRLRQVRGCAQKGVPPAWEIPFFAVLNDRGNCVWCFCQSFEASLTAFITAIALLQDSSYSASGSESATTPPPAWT